MTRFFPKVLCLIALVACDRSESPSPEQNGLLQVPQNLSFGEEGGWKTLSVRSDGRWQASTEADWLTLSPEEGYLDGEVTVTATPAAGPQRREAVIEFRSGSVSVPTSVSQQGMAFRDLGAGANCYIVPPAEGFYSFSASYKGNAADKKLEGVAEARIVWQDRSDLVKETTYDPATRRIGFSLSGSECGNAVIAAVDGEGEILWSWHLWIADFDPEKTCFEMPSAGNDSKWTFMDRNLGAVTAEAGDIGALGLLYQWGRKDPFPGVGGFDGREKTVYDGEGRPLPTPCHTAASYGTLELSVRNPSVFYKISYRTNDWTQPSDDDLWGGVSRTKTVWDPCPAGWRVPLCDTQGASPYGLLTDQNTIWSETLAGRSFEGWWLPCTGTRIYESGELSFDIGGPYGGMWIGTAGKANPDTEQFPALYGQYLFVIDGALFGTNKDARSQGMAVRCVRE